MNLPGQNSRAIFLWLLLMAVVQPTMADPIGDNHLLVSSWNSGFPQIREYTTSGTLVQTFSVPKNPGANLLRDIALDGLGRIQAYDGTFTPLLTTVTPGSGSGNATFQSHTISGWSTISHDYYGGIAVDIARNAVYASDMVTGSGGEANGIVRFDLTTFSASRFLSGPQYGSGDYTTVTLGKDGLLYTMYPGLSAGNYKVDVIDPANFTILRTVNLPDSGNDYTGIAVDADGNIYAADEEARLGGSNHILVRFNPQGIETKRSMGLPLPVHDLSISDDGRLVTMLNQGDIYITTTTLDSFSSFNSGIGSAGSAYVIWTVPEPNSASLLIIALMFGSFVWCLSSRAASK